MTDNKEMIICSAIHFEDDQYHPHQPINTTSGFVVCGLRHSNCYATAGILDPHREYKRLVPTQGFLTNTNKFVDRYLGMIIALEAGQVKSGETQQDNKLFSEDLF